MVYSYLKTASTLITASGSSVNLLNSTRFCRTFWKVGSSATLGTNSHFVGHILAMESITANTGATVQGQLMARNGAVTLDNNTITNGICETTPTAPVVKSSVPAVKLAATTLPVVNSVKNTVTGGQLPNTSTHLYDVLLIGSILTLVGALGWRSRKRYE